MQGTSLKLGEMLEEDRHERCNIVRSFHRSTLECHEPRIKGALEPMSDDLRRTRHTRRKKIRRSQADRRRTRSRARSMSTGWAPCCSRSLRDMALGGWTLDSS